MPSGQGRYASIDGLRGFLAFSVFLHHSCIWFFYLKKSGWAPPPSNLYAHLGASSVSMFFMITGFLFFSKLIDGKEKRIDWTRLFVSRVLRLTPLYLFAMTLIFILAIYESKGVFNQPIHVVQMDALKWFTFRIFGDKPNLGGVTAGFATLAGVTLTLRHEWYFYFSLPFLALAVRSNPSAPLTILSFLAFLIWRPHEPTVLAFTSGILAAMLVRNEAVCRLARKHTTSMVALACLVVAVMNYSAPNKAISIILVGMAFNIIACGNTMFGLLLHPASRTLGEISYGIYLLHSLLLFVAFNFILSPEASRSLTPFFHWSLVIALTPILIFGCFITFRLIEHPAMQQTVSITDWLRTRLTRSDK